MGKTKKNKVEFGNETNRKHKNNYYTKPRSD